MATSKPKAKTGNVDPAEAQRRHDFMDDTIRRFSGSLDELESALGMYMIGRHFGWKVLYLLHSKRTVNKYEQILGIDVREEFEPEGPDASRSNGFRLAQQFSNFWKVVSGEEKIDREQRKQAT